LDDLAPNAEHDAMMARSQKHASSQASATPHLRDDAPGSRRSEVTELL